MLLVLPIAVVAQVVSEGRVEVLVADQGSSQRNSAYWLALDQVLQRDVPGFAANPQRKEILDKASSYVQSFRYTRVNPVTANLLLATRAVRDGADAASVIEVTFPEGLAALVQEQLAPQPLVTESVVIDETPVLALIAVDQDGAQFLIGGERGKKFQARMLQLGVANSLNFEFPVFDDADLAVLSPSDVLYNQVSRQEAVMTRYATAKRMTGALFRLSADAWQSEWRYTVPGKAEQSVTLTTATLDEALITAISELANSSADGFASVNVYQNGGDGYQRTGVGVRIENIASLADYQRVLAMLRTIDNTVVTESLDVGATVFRATAVNASVIRDALSRQPQLSPLPINSLDSGELGFRFQAR